MAKNLRLVEALEPGLEAAEEICGETGEGLPGIAYRTLDSWSREGRVIGKAEALLAVSLRQLARSYGECGLLQRRTARRGMWGFLTEELPSPMMAAQVIMLDWRPVDSGGLASSSRFRAQARQRKSFILRDEEALKW